MSWRTTLAVAGVAAGLALAPSAARPAPQDEWDGLPEGPGREEVYGLCQGCHALDIVTQQRMTRTRWDDTLTWMVDSQGMPELPDDLRRTVLDYLSEHFGPKEAGGCKETPWGLRC